MAFNGTGVFARLFNWVNDRNAAIDISASRMDQEMDGFATGLSNCLLKDGTQTVTANIPMNSKKFTGLAAGSASGDSVHYGQTSSTTAIGLVELATDAEGQAGTDTARAVTPSVLKATNALWLVTAATPAAAASITITLPSGYSGFDLYLDYIYPSVNGTTILGRVVSGGVTQATGYSYTFNGARADTGANYGVSGNAGTSFEVINSGSNAVGHFAHIYIPNPSGVVHHKQMRLANQQYTSGGYTVALTGGATWLGSTAAITGIVLFVASGNVNVSYRLIGHR